MISRSPRKPTTSIFVMPEICRQIRTSSNQYIYDGNGTPGVYIPAGATYVAWMNSTNGTILGAMLLNESYDDGEYMRRHVITRLAFRPMAGWTPACGALDASYHPRPDGSNCWSSPVPSTYIVLQDSCFHSLTSSKSNCHFDLLHLVSNAFLAREIAVGVSASK